VEPFVVRHPLLGEDVDVDDLRGVLVLGFVPHILRLPSHSQLQREREKRKVRQDLHVLWEHCEMDKTVLREIEGLQLLQMSETQRQLSDLIGREVQLLQRFQVTKLI
jgi:hypothetical protein